MTNHFRNLNVTILRSFLCGCVLVALLAGAASAATSSVQVQFASNAPVGRVLSLELTVNSAQLVRANGVAVSVVSRPFTLEQSHLGASAEVVGSADISSGAYTMAVVTVSNPHVVFLDNFGNIRESRWVGTSLTTTLLKQAISAGSSPSVVRFSLDMASLMKFDPVHQTMVRSQPAVTVSQLFPGRVGADAEVAGELEATVGKVSLVSATSFSVTDAVSGLSTTYLVDRNTAYNGVSLRTMSGLLVRVHATTHSDGKLLAQDVSISGSGAGSVVTGVLTDATGTKVTAQQVYGAGASLSLLGSLATVALDSSASFQIDSKGMDLTALPQAFSRDNMVAGQRVQFISRSSMQSSSNTTAGVTQAMIARLQLQVISGTVTNVSVALNGATSFDLQLPLNDGSILGLSTDMVHVVTQPLTKTAITTFTEGMQVKVRGLLLFDGISRGMQNSAVRGFITTPKDGSNYFMIARSVQRDSSHK